MFQVSSRDETFLKLNDAMTLRHSRKRDKVYLKKLFYLRNFLNLLHVYRVFLAWKFRKRPQNALKWHRRQAIAWKRDMTIAWHPKFYQRGIHTTEVIFRFHECQLTVTRVINLPSLFLFDIATLKDKKLKISFGREKIKESLMVVCEGEDDGECQDFGSFCRELEGKLSVMEEILFSGQMLMNWFAQSLQSLQNLNKSLTENDFNALTLHYCSNLLVAGVIKQLDGSSDSFKVSEIF